MILGMVDSTAVAVNALDAAMLARLLLGLGLGLGLGIGLELGFRWTTRL